MTTNEAIAWLVAYAEQNDFIEPADRRWAVNQLLSVLKLNSWEYTEVSQQVDEAQLPQVLDVLLDDAVSRGVIEDSITERDFLDTALMGSLTPRPTHIIREFWGHYEQSPKEATDWYYGFSKDTNYIRKDRIAKDIKWVVPSEYGDIDITINLSKPEKDPKDIAAALAAKQNDALKVEYPTCQLCAESEGYTGRFNYPARQNHRIIPLQLNGEDWFFQYSPYVYYNEHCIVLNSQHTPMKIDRSAFCKLLEFVDKFPRYFVGSNADLPIVGGSILTHDHFQGGRYTFAMERAPIETPLSFIGYEDVEAGIVKWPLSVIRLRAREPQRLVDLADRILCEWRGYSDPEAGIFADTDGEPHNTITPIARRRGDDFELDLVLRNNLTTEEHPLGVFHPHQELHHIKKENIGLIEVMGLAVLPARLKTELAALADALVAGTDISSDEMLAKHAEWAQELSARYTFTPDNVDEILQQEVGAVFVQVLEHAGVYKRTPEGHAAFLRFIEQVNTKS